MGALISTSQLTRRAFVRLGATCVAGGAVLAAGCGGGGGAGGAEAASDKPSGTVLGTPPSSPSQWEVQERTVFVFDTVVTLKANCDPAVMDAAVERCEYFESIFSRTIPTSDIGRVNAAGGQPVQVAPETADLVQKALAYCEESDGRFDITIGAVSTLWDFKQGVVPDADVLAEAVSHVDWRGVEVEGDTITLADPAAKLDLGGIAKGYIADDLCALFIEGGCDSGLVNLGGNAKTIGLKPDGSAWNVGIQDPNDVTGAVIAKVSSQDSSVVTSGLYERQFELDGKRYWHILDPATGWPVQTDLVSASIVSDASIDGDGCTKPLFMMGRDQALEWIESKPGIEALLVGVDGAIVQSSGCNATLL